MKIEFGDRIIELNIINKQYIFNTSRYFEDVKHNCSNIFFNAKRLFIENDDFRAVCVLFVLIFIIFCCFV